MLKRIKQRATVFGTFFFTKRGDLEQGLSHALEGDDFLHHFCEFRLCSFFDLFTGGLPVHAQRQQLQDLFEGETQKFRALNEANPFDHSFRILSITRGAACHLSKSRGVPSLFLLQEDYTPCTILQSQVPE
jgi:hypothetical protein